MISIGNESVVVYVDRKQGLSNTLEKLIYIPNRKLLIYYNCKYINYWKTGMGLKDLY